MSAMPMVFWIWVFLIFFSRNKFRGYYVGHAYGILGLCVLGIVSHGINSAVIMSVMPMAF